MEWLWQNPGPAWQWVGLAAGLIGTVLTLWAAVAAQDARTQARRAYEAAVRLTRVTQSTELVADLHELEVLVAHGDVHAAASKANHLRGRIARFLNEAYDELGEIERTNLALAREQLAQVPSIAAGRRQSENKLAAIRIAIGEVGVSLNVIAGVRVAANRREREMATDLRAGVNYEPLIAALLRKSREGKVDWRETAEDESFLASVRGEETYQVSRRGDICELVSKDKRGRTVLRVTEPYYVPPAFVTPDDEQNSFMTGKDSVTTLGCLHSAARRIALQLDERIQSSVRLLDSL